MRRTLWFSLSYSAAQVAATRVIKKMDAQFEELKSKATGLEQQLTDISKRVTQVSEQLKEVEQAVKALREQVTQHA